MLLSLGDNQPISCLKEPAIQNIIPAGDAVSKLACDITVKFKEEDGNVLKQRLLESSKYVPAHMQDPEDQNIRWDNSSGSKT